MPPTESQTRSRRNPAKNTPLPLILIFSVSVLIPKGRITAAATGRLQSAAKAAIMLRDDK
jgi:hypothetical protein